MTSLARQMKPIPMLNKNGSIPSMHWTEQQKKLRRIVFYCRDKYLSSLNRFSSLSLADSFFHFFAVVVVVVLSIHLYKIEEEKSKSEAASQREPTLPSLARSLAPIGLFSFASMSSRVLSFSSLVFFYAHPHRERVSLCSSPLSLLVCSIRRSQRQLSLLFLFFCFFSSACLFSPFIHLMHTYIFSFSLCLEFSSFFFYHRTIK